MQGQPGTNVCATTDSFRFADQWNPTVAAAVAADPSECAIRGSTPMARWISENQPCQPHSGAMPRSQRQPHQHCRRTPARMWAGGPPVLSAPPAARAHAVHKLRTPRTPLHWQPMGAPLWRTCHKDKGGEAGSSAKPASLIKHGKNTPTDLLRRTHSVPDNRHKQRDRQTRTATGSAGPGCVMCGGSVCN